ncbi:hypothetical protein [Niabella hibiscisoli]|uniref:hypothetical protein n=1 Tax=Niabella hibiscisoli TaxID=1825928 RepID=UPI00293F36BC|nr:hypothetical protein [Niabella hibiscisoli]
MAQSIFQVGGNAGSAAGPLLAALIVIPFGQKYISWFGLLALLAIAVLSFVGKWYQQNIQPRAEKRRCSLGRVLLRQFQRTGLLYLSLFY